MCAILLHSSCPTEFLVDSQYTEANINVMKMAIPNFWNGQSSCNNNVVPHFFVCVLFSGDLTIIILFRINNLRLCLLFTTYFAVGIFANHFTTSGRFASRQRTPEWCNEHTTCRDVMLKWIITISSPFYSSKNDSHHPYKIFTCNKNLANAKYWNRGISIVPLKQYEELI